MIERVRLVGEMPHRRDGEREPSLGGNDVMATVDRSNAESLFVIADVSTDDAWIATPTSDAPRLAGYR